MKFSGDKVRQLQRRKAVGGDCIGDPTEIYAGQDPRTQNGGIPAGVPVGVWTSAGQAWSILLPGTISHICEISRIAN
ncbi:MAG: hypothetical protein ACLT76_01465 [Clostridium fessum]